MLKKENAVISKFNIKGIDQIGEDIPLMEIFEENEELTFGVDFLPKPMMNTYIYDSYFNIYYRNGSRNNVREHKKYEMRFLKVILTIMGYSHDLYIESEELRKGHGESFAKIPAEEMGNVYLAKNRNSLAKAFSINIGRKGKKLDQQMDLPAILKKALRDKTEVTIYLCDLKLILFITDLYVSCLAEEKQAKEFLEGICNVEGLYVR
ncbi:hypothetical protein PWEIH_06686 [Listeria weihenstephanensis FSL R9-0317]|uniref:Uncharacterized protein n=1 Tax=Listeria weihenstephanensis TaxID=1006155 RepID=A0A1S7FQJ6_9LIST|nr:hypothetical protein [Listeria weihenstephanensis]AQY49657.1 hypothetical protein UE46_00305 [Listeria weihenstephanensis]EUJ39585.1 hypothetical protein PWEIH_06686 [Listeria weihenstephanensis FSL R9-0317]